jgi:hypothetical protein
MALGGRAANAELLVERGPGAEECPDSAELARRVERIRERSELGKASYRLVFTKRDAGLAVAITAEPSGRARTLTSNDATCDAIANAAAVTLALLFDAEPVEAPPAAPVSTPTPSPAPAKPIPAPPRPAVSARRAVQVTFSLAASTAAGVTAPLAFGGMLEAGLVAGRLRTSLGALWLAPVASALPPGQVREGLVGGTARGCFAPLMGAWRVDLCSGAFLGVASADATGYTTNETRHRPWLAIPAELAGSWWTEHVALEASVAALFPVQRRDFGIEGLGVPYRSSAVGLIGSLRVLVIPSF